MKYNKSVSDKVIEQLSGLSDWMTSEFDAESDRVYYEHANYITKTVEQLQDYGKGNLSNPEIYIDPWLVDMDTYLFKIRNNVFIPEDSKHEILSYYTMRCYNMMRISDQKLKEYSGLLDSEKLDYEDERLPDKCWNEINDLYYESGIGWSQVELKVQYFNILIQDYLYAIEV